MHLKSSGLAQCLSNQCLLKAIFWHSQEYTVYAANQVILIIQRKQHHINARKSRTLLAAVLVGPVRLNRKLTINEQVMENMMMHAGHMLTTANKHLCHILGSGCLSVVGFIILNSWICQVQK